MARKETNFKQTDIGLIPIDWDVLSIRELGPMSKGLGISRSESLTGKIPAVRYGEIYTNHNDYIRSFTSFISAVTAKKARRLKLGDLLFTASGETKEDIGKCVAFIDDFEAYAGGDIIIVSTTNQDSMFLGYVLNSPIAKKQKTNFGQGDTVVHISAHALGLVQIPLPPLKEQKRIAEVLSHFDEHIDKLVALLEKRKQVKAATMHALLSGSTRLPGFTAPWQDKFLGDIAIIIMGLSPSSKFYNTEKRGLPLIQGNADIGVDRKQLVRVYTTEITNTCDVGDIIFSVRAPVGSVGIANYKSCIGRGVCSIKYQNAFLYHLLIKLEKSWSQLAQGSTFDSITRSQLEEKRLYIPTSLVEQSTIATVLSNMDRGIEALEQEIKKYRQMKEGAMEELLTGKTRLL